VPGLGEILLLVLLLGLSGFFSCSETSLFSLSRYRVKMGARGSPGGRRVAWLLARPKRLLASLVLGNMLVNVASAALAERIAVRWVGPRGLAAAVGVMTFLILVFGEIGPKSLAIRFAESIAPAVAPLVAVWCRAVYPIRAAALWAANAIVRAAGGGRRGRDAGFSDDELGVALQMGREAGALDGEEARLMRNILHAGRKRVGAIQTPRTEMFAVDLAAPSEEIRSAILQRQYARVPVYRKTPEAILGVLHARDVLTWLRAGRRVNLRRFLRAPAYIPENATLHQLMALFRRAHSELALVVDEFGDVTGVVTLRDLLDELLAGMGGGGVPPELCTVLPDGGARVKGLVEVDDLRRWAGIVLEGTDARTVGGVVTTLLDRVPVQGDTVRCGRHELTVTAATERRAEEIVIRRVEP